MNNAIKALKRLIEIENRVIDEQKDIIARAASYLKPALLRRHELNTELNNIQMEGSMVEFTGTIDQIQEWLQNPEIVEDDTAEIGANDKNTSSIAPEDIEEDDDEDYA